MSLLVQKAKDELEFAYKQEMIAKSESEIDEFKRKEKEAKEHLETARKNKADVITAKNSIHEEIVEHQE